MKKNKGRSGPERRKARLRSAVALITCELHKLNREGGQPGSRMSLADRRRQRTLGVAHVAATRRLL